MGVNRENTWIPNRKGRGFSNCFGEDQYFTYPEFYEGDMDPGALEACATKTFEID